MEEIIEPKYNDVDVISLPVPTKVIGTELNEDALILGADVLIPSYDLRPEPQSSSKILRSSVIVSDIRQRPSVFNTVLEKFIVK